GSSSLSADRASAVALRYNIEFKSTALRPLIKKLACHGNCSRRNCSSRPLERNPRHEHRARARQMVRSMLLVSGCWSAAWDEGANPNRGFHCRAWFRAREQGAARARWRLRARRASPVSDTRGFHAAVLRALSFAVLSAAAAAVLAAMLGVVALDRLGAGALLPVVVTSTGILSVERAVVVLVAIAVGGVNAFGGFASHADATGGW